MQFMTALFGGNGNSVLNAIFALGIVLGLIVLGLWLLKLFTNASASIGQIRKRLMVVESASLDGKRKVVIVRRDNVEHLILTGGPQDVVIESGIAAPEQNAPLRRPRSPQPEPAAAAAQPAPADITAPSTHEGHVPREAVDRLGDLARPAPLRPRPALRHTALLRPVAGDTVIPIAGDRRGENSAGQ